MLLLLIMMVMIIKGCCVGTGIHGRGGSALYTVRTNTWSAQRPWISWINFCATTTMSDSPHEKPWSIHTSVSGLFPFWVHAPFLWSSVIAQNWRIGFETLKNCELETDVFSRWDLNLQPLDCRIGHMPLPISPNPSIPPAPPAAACVIKKSFLAVQFSFLSSVSRVCLWSQQCGASFLTVFCWFPVLDLSVLPSSEREMWALVSVTLWFPRLWRVKCSVFCVQTPSSRSRGACRRCPVTRRPLPPPPARVR